MKAQHLTNWVMAGIIATAMSASWMLDGPSELDAIQAIADSVDDAQQQDAAQHYLVTQQVRP